MTERAAVLDLVLARVRVRFLLDAERFADWLVERARGQPSAEPLDARLEPLSLDDLYLTAACSMKEERAWEELSATHFDFMRQFARRFLREPAAGDLADQVIAELWDQNKIARYAGRSTLRTWLAAVVANAALNAAKADKRVMPLDAPGARSRVAVATDPDPAGERESSELLAKLIVEVIRDLSDDDKLLLLMYYEQGLTLENMTAVIGGSRATLSRRLKDTRGRFWASLDQLARDRVGAPASALKEGVDLGRIDFDLEAALGAIRSVDERRRNAV